MPLAYRKGRGAAPRALFKEGHCAPVTFYTTPRGAAPRALFKEGHCTLTTFQTTPRGFPGRGAGSVKSMAQFDSGAFNRMTSTSFSRTMRLKAGTISCLTAFH
ncbi:MAG: hypothetical protein RI973_1479 [Bacteroidota bacterium]